MSFHWPTICLFKNIFRIKTRTTPKLWVSIGVFSQRTSNAKTFPHHDVNVTVSMFVVLCISILYMEWPQCTLIISILNTLWQQSIPIAYRHAMCDAYLTEIIWIITINHCRLPQTYSVNSLRLGVAYMYIQETEVMFNSGNVFSSFGTPFTNFN